MYDVIQVIVSILFDLDVVIILQFAKKKFIIIWSLEIVIH